MREVYQIKDREDAEKLIGPSKKFYVEFPGRTAVPIPPEEIFVRQHGDKMVITAVQVGSTGRRGARYCFPQLTNWRNVFGDSRGELIVAFRAHCYVQFCS